MKLQYLTEMIVRTPWETVLSYAMTSNFNPPDKITSFRNFDPYNIILLRTLKSIITLFSTEVQIAGSNPRRFKLEVSKELLCRRGKLAFLPGSEFRRKENRALGAPSEEGGEFLRASKGTAKFLKKCRVGPQSFGKRV